MVGWLVGWLVIGAACFCGSLLVAAACCWPIACWVIARYLFERHCNIAYTYIYIYV